MKALELLTLDQIETCKLFYYETDDVATVASKQLPDDERAEQLAEYIYMSPRFNPIDDSHKYICTLARE